MRHGQRTTTRLRSAAVGGNWVGSRTTPTSSDDDFIVCTYSKPAMSCPLLADSLNLDSWSVDDFKVTTKSKQRYAPISASGKPALFKLSSEPLMCPWGVGKFQDLDSGRIALDLIVEDCYLLEALEK